LLSNKFKIDSLENFFEFPPLNQVVGPQTLTNFCDFWKFNSQCLTQY